MKSCKNKWESGIEIWAEVGHVASCDSRPFSVQDTCHAGRSSAITSPRVGDMGCARQARAAGAVGEWGRADLHAADAWQLRGTSCANGSDGTWRRGGVASGSVRSLTA